MAKKPSAGSLTYRATFAAPVPTGATDPDGMLISGHGAQFTVWCGVQWKRGGETVEQARMQSRSPAVLTVRDTPDTRRITSEWQATIHGGPFDGRVFAVKEDPTPTPDRAFLEMLSESRGQT